MRSKYWLIFFEDPERAPEIYTEAEAARAAYELHGHAWNCTLFREVDCNFRPEERSADPERNEPPGPSEITQAMLLGLPTRARARRRTTEGLFAEQLQVLAALTKKA